MNTYTVEYLDTAWHQIAGKAVMPLNIGNFLDERLDEAQIVVYNDSRSEYKPNTAIRITATVGSPAESKSFLFKVASDQAQEYPNGSGNYKHTLGLVELTKYLEGIVCQTLTFTNVIPTQYAGIPIEPTSYVGGLIPSGFKSSSIITPAQNGVVYIIPSSQALGHDVVQAINNNPSKPIGYTYSIKEEESFGSNKTKVHYNGADYFWNTPINVTPTSGSLSFAYTFVIQSCDFIGGGVCTDLVYTMDFTVPIVSSASTRKWTIATVCDRLFDLAEPITDANDTPRFALSSADHAELDKITAPEFTMSQSTLREQLKVVGGRIHAEPRVTGITYNAAKQRYEYTVGFDYFSKYSMATLPNDYLMRMRSRTIDQYVTQIHTNPSNLVNSLRDTRGTITDPGKDKFRSLRTEQSNVRVTDSNGEIQSAYPIYNLEKLMVGIFKRDTTTGVVSTLLAPQDVTAYVFEATEYDSVLTDYRGAYPKSKKYALRYKRGEKNVTQLFYQCPNVISQALSDYSVVNILSAVSSVSAATIQGYLNQAGASIVAQTTYKPIFNAAFTHGKTEYTKDEPYTAVYNQSNGLVELTYYGEHVKGVAQRLGNADIAVTCVYAKYSQIPAVGDSVRLASDVYAVSAVQSEMTSTAIKCTISLTKDFNRISQYVGIDSRKRIEQISLDQSYDRDIIIKENLVIGNKPQGYTASGIIGGGCAAYFRDIFDPNYTGTHEQMRQALFGYKNGINDQTLNDVVLPVVGSGEGNVTVLTTSFKDNYSAGTNVDYLTGNNSVNGFWQADVPYSDYYGRAKYLTFRFFDTLEIASEAFQIPKAYTTSLGNDPIRCALTPMAYLVRKDSRERFSTFNYCIEAKTTIDGLNIGSGISQLNSLVSNALVADAPTYHRARVYLVRDDQEFPYRLDDTITDYDYTNWAYNNISITSNADGTFYINQLTAPENYQGFVVAIPPYPVTETVYNEDGTTSQQTTYKFGNILLSMQKAIHTGDPLFGEEYTFRMEK